MTIGVDTLPPLPKHAGDRNRTSPFAFTGNKFEFRAVGSSQSIAGPLVVLNTIVAESLDYIATRAGKSHRRRSEEAQRRRAKGGGKTSIKDAQGRRLQRRRLLGRMARRSREARSAEPEEHDRGLAGPDRARRTSSCSRSTTCSREREVHSRYEIYVERYCKDINMEGLTALAIAKTMILPAAYRYQGELAGTAASLKALGKTAHIGHARRGDRTGGRAGRARSPRLEAAMDHHGRRRSDGRSQALRSHTSCRP